MESIIDNSCISELTIQYVQILLVVYGVQYSQTVANFVLNFWDIFVDIFNAVAADTMVQCQTRIDLDISNKEEINLRRELGENTGGLLIYRYHSP